MDILFSLCPIKRECLVNQNVDDYRTIFKIFVATNVITFQQENCNTWNKKQIFDCYNYIHKSMLNYVKLSIKITKF